MPRKPKATRKPVVVERKLGREGVWGLAWGDGKIEIDPRQSARQYCDTLVHEALHELFPNESETGVRHAAHVVTALLWASGFRRIRP